MIEEYRAYYNFIRNNQSLKGKTPAEMAKINLELGRNRWYSIIKKSGMKTGNQHKALTMVRKTLEGLAIQ